MPSPEQTPADGRRPPRGELTPAAAALLTRLRPQGAPHLHEMPLTRARAYADALPSLLGPGPDVARVEDTLAGGIPVRVYEPAGEVAATVTYFHGGGWVLGGIDNDDALVRQLVCTGALRVVSVGYRLAPEHPFPAALQDAVEAVRWTTGRFDRRVVVAGESAGANLAASAALRLRADPAVALGGQVLVCPLLDATVRASYADCGADGLLTAADVAWFWSQYAPDPAVREDPRAAPMRCPDLRGAPPSLVVTAGHDPLRDEGAEYATRLAGAGVAVRHEHHPGLMHGFLPLAPILPEAGDVVTSIAAWIGLLA